MIDGIKVGDGFKIKLESGNPLLSDINGTYAYYSISAINNDMEDYTVNAMYEYDLLLAKEKDHAVELHTEFLAPKRLLKRMERSEPLKKGDPFFEINWDEKIVKEVN